MAVPATTVVVIQCLIKTGQVAKAMYDTLTVRPGTPLWEAQPDPAHAR